MCVCVCVFLKVLRVRVRSQKQDRDCSFVAHSCPTLGISRYSPGSEGFSEAPLIGCNLLFKLKSRRASSLAVYKQLMHGTPILLVTTGVYLFPLSCGFGSYLGGRLTPPPAARGPPAVNSYSVAGPSGGRGAAGGFGPTLQVSVGMMARFLGIGGASFSSALMK